MVLLENVANQTVRLTQMQVPIVFGHDSCGILASVLEVGQRVIKRLINGSLTDNSDNSTHSDA